MAKNCCPLCEKSYTRSHNLKTHFSTYHPNEIINYPMIFASKKSTKINKPWRCPFEDCICGYMRKGDLKTHLQRVHKDRTHKYPDIMKPKSSKIGKRYQCPIDNCNCGYLRRNDLKNHINKNHSHIASYPYYQIGITQYFDNTELANDTNMTTQIETSVSHLSATDDEMAVDVLLSLGS